MAHSKKWIAAAVFSSLLVSHNWNAAHAAAGPLDGIDSQLIYKNFPIEGITDVSEEGDPSVIPGCAQVKSFEVVDGAPGTVMIAICKDGDFGPEKIEATVARQVAQARQALKTVPPHVANFMLSGIDAVEVPLDAGGRGKVLTIPAIGHGFAMLPIAYAVTAGKDAAIFVQAYLDPNKPRNLNEPMGALLQAIHHRVSLRGQSPGA
jgi:hypothetical protein